MTRSREVTQEELNDILKDLKNKLIVVEGKRDKKALKSLGLKDIITIEGKPLYEVAEKIKTKKEIVILTDFDKKGREMNSKLKNLLQRYKLHVNSRLRGKVMSLGKNNIEDLGHLSSQIDLKEVDIHVKISTKFNKIFNKSSDKRKRSNRET